MISIYCDGGVCKSNPSPYGGSWAYVFTEEDKEIHRDSGILLPSDVKLPTITNNMTELYAAIKALEAAPENWSGTLHTDSKITMVRLLHGNAGFAGIPETVRMRLIRAKMRLKRFKVILLSGHPTKEQLASGIGKRGTPCSKFNVLCDELCKKRCAELRARVERTTHGHLPQEA